MGGRTGTTGTDGPGRESESYAKVLGNLVSVLAALVVLGLVIASGRTPEKAEPKAPAPVIAEVRVKPVKAAKPAPVAPTPTPIPEPPKLDRVAVSKAEAELDALTRDRARAEARAEEASQRLADASARAAADARASKTLAFRVRDPSTRITQAAAKGGFLKAENEKLKGEIATLAKAPRPKANVLSNKNPVARASDGDEHHFELRHNRVSYVDLDRLLMLVKADAQLRIRLSDSARVVESQVGPVGPFSMRYSLGRSLPSGMQELMERRGISYDLRGWEVVPEFEGRGETFEASRTPVSEYTRAINRISPLKGSVTFWIYSDSFPLFRKLRDDLQARGYLVAARPLPDGMAIRGSPSGSLSAGQ